MIMSRRSALTLLAVAGLAGCSATGETGAERPSAKPKITVGLTYIPNVQFCAFYLGLKEGLFRDVDVTLRHHGEQEGLFDALRAGQEDIVFASADEAAVAGGLATVATAYQTYPAEVMISGHASSLADLKGRSLGIPGRYGSSYYAALVALKTAGLSEQDVQLTEIGYTSVAALTTGKVDAVVGFSNNELVRLRDAGHEVTSLRISPEPMLVGPSLITLPDKAQSPQVRAVIDGMLAAELRAVADPEAALAATAEQVPALAEEEHRRNAKLVLAATSKLWRGADGEVSVAVDQEALRRMEQFLAEAGIRQ
ncbi:ABC transporter substrate-binding protein [Tessaracoccus sp. OH4464_COT-324]|uniref:ABC transporter substrate-binding protein n=1 Tax=Tessaracoccus sp. OH4464_COT-324 TaxID=2491059 RepID=UPI000F63F3EA|nr:ABC transporter substrate-binding protein [Tessaracoccus sp. OH4464_COT-324]RRD46014.1 ABC transporter substrate-binding protein [Tessaracoccus sp. OH4464_COT-324]